MTRDNLRTNLMLFFAGLIPAVWLGLLIAPVLAEERVYFLQNFTTALNNPFHIEWRENSLKTVLLFVLLYSVVLLYFSATKKNKRPREEHGSAKWGRAKAVCKKYRENTFASNKILTKNVRISFDGHKHRRNVNTLVVGGSGSGKTRFFAKPNVMQCNSSMVILDPKGEILRDTGYLLRSKGMELRVLDLINMRASHCYNPFFYLKDESDIQRLVTNLFKATNPPGSKSQDPFWDNAAAMLLSALVAYLFYEAPPEEQNFSMVLEMLRAAEVREDDDAYQSPLDDLFSTLRKEEPDHIAIKYYDLYRSGAGKTLMSIHITLAVKLEKFNLPALEKLTMTDDLDITTMGEKKTALFIIIPDSDTSLNFLVSILYTQLFQTLFYQADHIHRGSLPVHVHFVMDEFANVCLPSDFEKELSTMRSRGVSVSIILQNLAQLKALFEKQWESIVGNCDEFLYLGGNEQSTHEYVSKLLGKETIDTNTFGKSSGRSGSFSTNYQNAGRELLTPDEVRMLDNRYALLFIRGERPIMDEKYDILKHPNIRESADGDGQPYLHGVDQRSNGMFSVISCMVSGETGSHPDTEFIADGVWNFYDQSNIHEYYENKKEQTTNETQQDSEPQEQNPIYPVLRYKPES